MLLLIAYPHNANYEDTKTFTFNKRAVLQIVISANITIMIVISVFVAVLSSDPKSPISERLAITGALCAYYQVITGEDLHHRASVVIALMTATTLEPVLLY